MSILIKGVDMPKGDEIISLVIASDKWCAGFNEKYERIDTQAIPMPTPHGRLVDADKLTRKEIRHLFYHLPNGDIAVPLIDIEHAPTVIEAEE